MAVTFICFLVCFVEKEDISHITSERRIEEGFGNEVRCRRQRLDEVQQAAHVVVAGDFNAELAAVQGAAALPPAVPTGGIMTGLSGDFAEQKVICPLAGWTPR